MRGLKNIILTIALLGVLLNANSQVQLLKISTSNCKDNDYEYKPVFNQVWINDSVLQVQTKALANCIGIYKPLVIMHGPLINLEFNEYKIDSIQNGRIVADCNCVYHIVWDIIGIKKDTDFIILLNGQLSSNFNKDLISKVLNNYEIDDGKHYFHLLNAVDKNGLRQGVQAFRDNNVTKWITYHNGVAINKIE